MKRGGVRTFIAIELPEAVKEGLLRVIGRLRRSGARATWVKADAMHLTLRFLGEIDSSAVTALSESLRSRYASVPPIGLRVRGLSAFPNVRKPSIVWVGAEPLRGPLEQAQRIAEEGAAGLGLARDDKPFHPHITLARVRKPGDTHALTRAMAEETDVDLGAFTVTAVSLFSSELSQSGPRHTRIEEFLLQWNSSPGPSSAC